MNFMRQTGTKEQRANKALSEMGSSVVVGIATTKFIGVIVLTFAPSTLFRLYYFRMYLFIIIFGAFNGLMFLPTLLSIIGPETDRSEIIEAYKDEKFFDILYKKMQNSGKIKEGTDKSM
jgi:predicted RND superfamily exporter protein